MDSATLAKMAAIADAVLGRPDTPYEYRGEMWDATLKRLPPTCLLWRRFVEYDQARSAYDELEATHRRWSDKLTSINARLRVANPDTTDAAQFGVDFARGSLITNALNEQRQILHERQAARDRAHETWSQIWSAYQNLLSTMWQVEQQPRAMDVPGMVSTGRASRAELAAERARFRARNDDVFTL